MSGTSPPPPPPLSSLLLSLSLLLLLPSSPSPPAPAGPDAGAVTGLPSIRLGAQRNLRLPSSSSPELLSDCSGLPLPSTLAESAAAAERSAASGFSPARATAAAVWAVSPYKNTEDDGAADGRDLVVIRLLLPPPPTATNHDLLSTAVSHV